MIRAAFIAACAVLLALACASPSPDFAVYQSTMSGDFDGDDWDGVSHGRVLDYSGRQVDALVLHIIPPNDLRYEVTAIHYLPGIPLSIGDGWAESYVPSDAPNGLRAKPEYFTGEHHLTWDIHPGDPNGIYRIEIHINGNHVRTLEFDVRNVPPAT